MTFSAGELSGAAGVTLLLLAFLLNLTNKLRRENIFYILLNFLGGALACFSSILIRFLPFIILEGVWALVSFVALIRYFRNHA